MVNLKVEKFRRELKIQKQKVFFLPRTKSLKDSLLILMVSFCLTLDFLLFPPPTLSEFSKFENLFRYKKTMQESLFVSINLINEQLRQYTRQKGKEAKIDCSSC